MTEADAREALGLAVARLITECRGSGSVRAERDDLMAAADTYANTKALPLEERLAAIREQTSDFSDGDYISPGGTSEPAHFVGGGLHHGPGTNVGRCRRCFDALAAPYRGGTE